VWKDLDMDPGFATGLCVRSIKVCPGIQYCRLAQQDSLKMGMILDQTYHGMVLPSKMKMGAGIMSDDSGPCLFAVSWICSRG
jgi:NAD(P)H-nitrite reductase large subunit